MLPVTNHSDDQQTGKKLWKSIFPTAGNVKNYRTPRGTVKKGEIGGADTVWFALPRRVRTGWREGLLWGNVERRSTRNWLPRRRWWFAGAKVFEPCIILIGLMPTSYSATHSHGQPTQRVSVFLPLPLHHCCKQSRQLQRSPLIYVFPRYFVTSPWENEIIWKFSRRGTRCIARGEFLRRRWCSSVKETISRRAWKCLLALAWMLAVGTLRATWRCLDVCLAIGSVYGRARALLLRKKSCNLEEGVLQWMYVCPRDVLLWDAH